MKLEYQSVFLGDKFAAKLSGKTVTILGVGGLGSVVADTLARSGLNLRIIDKERVYEEDMPRQALYTHSELQKFKAKQIKEHLEKVSPTITVRTFHEELSASHVFLVKSDLVIDCTNFDKVSMDVAKYCKQQKLPYILAVYGGAEGIMLTSPVIGPKHVAIIQKLKAEKGVIGANTRFLGGLVSAAALKMLTGQKQSGVRANVWTGKVAAFK
jgi:tRNA A37 threonylcarbamoyladenosine dehydratase